MSFPQFYQNADMLTPDSTRGTGVHAAPEEPPSDFNEMLDPNEKKSKKLTSVRKAGLRKMAAAQGLQEDFIEAVLEEMEKEAIGWGLAARAVGKRLFGGIGKGPGVVGRIKSVPKVLGRAWRSQKPGVRTRRALPAGTTRGTVTGKALDRPASMKGVSGPLQKAPAYSGARYEGTQKITPTAMPKHGPGPGEVGGIAAGKAAPKGVDAGAWKRLQDVQAGVHTRDARYKALLAKHQTKFEKAMTGWKGVIGTQVLPWVAFPVAADILGLGTTGQMGAMGVALALPAFAGPGRFQRGVQRATQSYLRGA